MASDDTQQHKQGVNCYHHRWSAEAAQATTHTMQRFEGRKSSYALTRALVYPIFLKLPIYSSDSSRTYTALQSQSQASLFEYSKRLSLQIKDQGLEWKRFEVQVLRIAKRALEDVQNNLSRGLPTLPISYPRHIYIQIVYIIRGEMLVKPD